MTKEQILEAFKPFMLDNPKVGDRVFNIVSLEWVTITHIKLGEDFPIITNTEETFTVNGYYLKKHITPTIYKSNPFEALLKSNQERVVLVWNLEGQKLERRVLIKELPNGRVVCWNSAKTIEEVDYDNYGVMIWNHFKELPSKTPTLDQLKQAYADANGLNINEIIY